MVDAVDEDGSG